MRALASSPVALAAALLAGAGCQGEEIVLLAAPAVDAREFLACDRVRWEVRSIRVQVIEWHTVEDTEALDLECLNVEDPTEIRDAWSMLEWFDERGYVVRGVPVGVSTRVQLVGFPARDCPPTGATICAVNGEPLSGTTFDGEEVVPFSFICQCTFEACGEPEVPAAGRIWEANRQWLEACVYLEDLDDFGA
jgi:hypothetical protein